MVLAKKKKKKKKIATMNDCFMKRTLGEGSGPLDKFTKKQKGIPVQLKRAIWDMYIGPHVKEATCPLCGTARIERNSNSGFDAAHVVARKFLDKELSVYYLYPSCASCNNQCDDLCLLDYMWCRQRIAQLRRFIMAVFEAFVAEHKHDLTDESRYAWKVVEYLYGKETFKAGGGLQNAKQVYEVARTEQYLVLSQRAVVLARESADIANQMQALWEAKVQTFSLFH